MQLRPCQQLCSAPPGTLLGMIVRPLQHANIGARACCGPHYTFCCHICADKSLAEPHYATADGSLMHSIPTPSHD